jgi:hypothetical protein
MFMHRVLKMNVRFCRVERPRDGLRERLRGQGDQATAFGQCRLTAFTVGDHEAHQRAQPPLGVAVASAWTEALGVLIWPEL